MRLPTIKRLLLEDYPTEQKWIGKLILPINDFMDSVENAVNGNLTLTDNIVAQVKTLIISGSSAIQGDLIAGSYTIFNPSVVSGFLARLAVRGDAILTGSVIDAVFTNEFIDIADTTSVGTLDITGIADNSAYRVGQPISGQGVPKNATVGSIVGSTAIKIDKPLISGGSATANISLSRGIKMTTPALVTSLGTDVIIGGAYPVSFKKTISTKPISVHVGQVVEKSTNPSILSKGISVDWTSTTDTIIINNISGLQANRYYTVIFIILGQ